MKSNLNSQKRVLAPIAVKYICRDCKVVRFCIVDNQKNDCSRCEREVCPNEKEYTYREENSIKLNCCFTSKEL